MFNTLKKLYELHIDLLFVSERMELGKYKKLITSLHDKNEYVIHKIILQQASNHRLILKKVHRVIKFSQKQWLKPYIAINTELREKTKNNFEKDAFKLMNTAVFGKN